MKKSLQALITGTTFVLASCGSPSGGQHNTTDSTATDSTIGPVETKKPNSDYKPAFPGQTRINGIKTKTPYEGTVLSDKLENPWGITTLPDGRLLITEKKGVLRIATTSGQLSEPITGLPKVNPDGQGGLLGIRVDPDFKTNRMVYWVFSEPRPDGNLTAVAKGKLSADEKTIEDATVIYRATPHLKVPCTMEEESFLIKMVTW